MARSVRRKKLRADEFELELVVREEEIARLLERGGPWEFVSGNINGDVYPVSENGPIIIRYRRIPARKFFAHKKASRYGIARYWAKPLFQKWGVRFPTAAEMLLVLAENHRIGLEGFRLVAFVADGNGNSTFCVSSHGDGGKRHLVSLDNGLGYSSSDEFLAVVDTYPVNA